MLFGSLAATLKKLHTLPRLPLLLIVMLASAGFVTLYSAAHGNLSPWALKQIIRFGFGSFVLIAIALTPLRFWYRVAYPLYGVTFVLLLVVELLGFVGMGAQRWIDLYVFQLQPSEIMKITLMMVLAKILHEAPASPHATWGEALRGLALPCVLIIAPALLLLRQPDLGTAGILILGGLCVLWVAGTPVKIFMAAGVIGASALPILWSLLYGYQKNRILTFLEPELDPQGRGYHILQSKIAIGSSGFFGKGFMMGTQSGLNFLPEKQTDFIFTMLSEEWGMLGGLIIIALYAGLVVYGYIASVESRSAFGRLLGLGLISIFFLHVFINIAMVTGLVPVVGVPLPFVSYGGTSLLTMMVCFGLLLCISRCRDQRV